jgi:enoyl-CoA hydratase
MSDTDESTVLYEVRERVAWITIHRPEKLNALSGSVVSALDAAVRRAVVDDHVGSIVITGAGEKAFVAGADIAEMAAMDPREAQAFSRFLQDAFDRIEKSPKPVVAAVNGFALGGGCELAMACHVRIAADIAAFGQPEILLGLIPGAGGTQRLPRLVGRSTALDLILTGRRIDAAEAFRVGLVDRVVPIASLRDETAKYAGALAEKSVPAMARILDAVLTGTEMAQGEGMRLEAGLFGLCFATEDAREGTRAFLEKRKAVFKGR